MSKGFANGEVYLHILIIPAGNLFLRITGSQLIVLPLTRWIEWELMIETSTARNVILGVSTDPIGKRTGLLCRRVSGISLRQILTDSDSSPLQKFNAIRWSLDSLRLLHKHVALLGTRNLSIDSHGDATTSNVIVDVNNRAACWIDFDTRHQPNVSEADRRADDLRSLIYSAAVHLPASCFPELADILVAARFDDADCPAIRSETDKGMGTSRLRRNWHRAPLRWSTAMALRSALRQALAAARRPATQD